MNFFDDYENKDLNDVTDCLCLIKSGKTKGFGFFIKINGKFLPFKKSLLTSVSILAPNDIKNKKEIILEYKNSEKILKINDNRKIFSDNDLGYICIEIIDEDEIYDFIKSEKETFYTFKESFVNKKIYIPKYQNNTITLCSGKIISYEKNKLVHDCDIKKDSLGAPIFYGDNFFYVIGLQKGYNVNNKYSIGLPINDIAGNIMKNLYKVNENSFLDIISKKFKGWSLTKLVPAFTGHLDMIDIYEDYKYELINYYTTKSKIIFDTNKDDDSIVNFMSKVYGKSNLACYYNFSYSGKINEGNEDEVINSSSKNFVFLNGKFEFTKNNFDFGKNNIFIFGNYRQVEDDKYDFVSFRQQASSLLTKIKDSVIYCLFHRDLRDILAIKIENNFMKNKILMVGDYEFEQLITEKYVEDKIYEHIDEIFENYDDSKKLEVNIKELIIYEIVN